MLSYKEFEIISALINENKQLEDLADYIYKKNNYAVFESYDEVVSLLEFLEQKNYLDNNKVTDLAKLELEPLKVDNAIILAAGGSDISPKSIYSMPKGLYLKNGETLIERQINQLQEVGITDITIVVGYKQEMYFFLQKKWGINLEINPDFSKNNIYSIYRVVDKLKNTYICNCDNYFEKNPFSRYEYKTYHATVYKENASNELLVKKNKNSRILTVYSGEEQGECIYGHAYFDNSFSSQFGKFLKEDIDKFRVSSLFWEEFFVRYVDDLDMYARQYPADLVFEFDSIQETQSIESLFLENVSKKINQKICEVIKCEQQEISNIEILQKGLTNILFTFNVNSEKYIFRYPGKSSSFFIYRKNEVKAQQLAAKSKVDNTYLYIDESGIKISKFIDETIDLESVYYQDIEVMKRLARKIRKFHNEGFDLKNWQEYSYNPIKECERLMQEASKMKANLFELFEAEWENIKKLYYYTEKDNIKKTMCHNDINQDNCLLTDIGLNIIDWEFSGWNDPAYDFGRVIAGYEFDDPAIDQILEAYFGRSATEKEKLHWISYIGIHSWYYFGWALYKESINESTRDWMLFFYQQAMRTVKYAIPKYEAIYK